MNLKKRLFNAKTSAKLCLLLSGALLSFSITAHAQPTTPCDPEYMDALESRAWLEAQREISQNQNFIFKPDSVLEYTCFHGFLDEAASNFAANRQFSETDRWGGHPSGFSNTSTDVALTRVVLQPVIEYLTKNFNTTGNMGAYLNNRESIEYTPATTVTGGDYTCDQMQQVWLAARCMNFNEQNQNDYDGFFDFAYYEANDPRRENPTWALMCNSPDPRFAAARTSAFNQDEALFSLAASDEIIQAQGNGSPYNEDDIVTHLQAILPNNSCPGTAIPTGVKIERPDVNNGSQYDEMICPNPGCAAVPGGSTCTINPP